MSIIRRRFLVYAIMIISLTMAGNLVRDIVRLNQADNRLKEAEKELAETQKIQEELKRKIAEVNSDFWKEAQIRNVLKMSLPGEAVVVVPEEAVKARKAAGETGADEERESNLVKWLAVFGF